jgi:transcription elongation GreA/GreB family factor
MNTKHFFTRRGYAAAQARIAALNTRLKDLEKQSGEAVEAGTWHDNAAYEALVIDIRGTNQRLADEHAALNNAQLIDHSGSADEVGIGTVVKLAINGSDPEEFEIAGYGESEGNRIAYNTPLARAIMRARPGAIVPVQLGKLTKQVTIISIKKAEVES